MFIALGMSSCLVLGSCYVCVSSTAFFERHLLRKCWEPFLLKRDEYWYVMVLLTSDGNNYWRCKDVLCNSEPLGVFSGRCRSVSRRIILDVAEIFETFLWFVKLFASNSGFVDWVYNPCYCSHLIDLEFSREKGRPVNYSKNVQRIHNT